MPDGEQHIWSVGRNVIVRPKSRKHCRLPKCADYLSRSSLSGAAAFSAQFRLCTCIVPKICIFNSHNFCNFYNFSINSFLQLLSPSHYFSSFFYNSLCFALFEFSVSYLLPNPFILLFYQFSRWDSKLQIIRLLFQILVILKFYKNYE